MCDHIGLVYSNTFMHHKQHYSHTLSVVMLYVHIDKIVFHYDRYLSCVALPLFSFFLGVAEKESGWFTVATHLGTPTPWWMLMKETCS